MKPRTKLHIRIVELSNSLPDIKAKVEPWAFRNCIDHIGYRNKIWTSCLSCGHVWPTTSMEIKTEQCPGCSWKIKLLTTRMQKSRDWARFSVLDVKEDFQVIRFFDINCHMKARKEPYYYTREVMQHWILPDGKFEIMSVQVGGLGMSYDHFCGGEISIKNKKDIWKYNVSVYKIYPKMKLLPVYKRNGMVSGVMNIPPFELLRKLISDSKTETLLKAKQYGLLAANLGDRKSEVYRYWTSIKICLRNRYMVNDVITWLDYLNLLTYFNKDLHNTKYVCPKDLKCEHDRLVAKKREIQRTEEAERNIIAAEKRKKLAAFEQKDYIESKGRFFGLLFSEGDLYIKVLETVQEFIEEGDAHRHCIYTNKYYAKEGSLCFSAKVNGSRVETIEVSLKDFKVVQSRGLGNKASEYHDQIIELLTRNMREVKKRSLENKDVAA